MIIVRHLRVEHGKLEGTCSKKILIADSCKALIFELAQIAVSRLKIINTFEYLSLLSRLVTNLRLCQYNEQMQLRRRQTMVH